MNTNKIISVVSGKGGVGKSTVSLGIAQSLAECKKRVLLIDMDFGLRSIDYMLGIQDRVVYDIGDVLEERCDLDKAIVNCPTNSNLSVLFSPNDFSTEVDLKLVASLIVSLTQDYDFIILDMPAGIGLSVLFTKKLANLAIVVSHYDEITARDCRKVVDLIERESDCEMRLIVNNLSKHSFRRKAFKNMDILMDVVGVQLLGVVATDNEINDSLTSEKDTRTKRIFQAITKRILGEYTELIVKHI